MGLYDYRNYSDAEVIDRLVIAKQLASYTSVPAILDLPTAGIVQDAEALFGVGTLAGNDIDLSLPAGWREVGIAELGLDPELLDSQGFIKFMSPLTGWTETGPQLKVLAQTDAAGHIIGLTISFAGTNSLVDVLDYLQLNADALVPNMAPVLTAVRDLALAHGLDGTDVTITGYSLGGGMTNIMSRHADTLIDGFFASSDYFGFAAPVIHEDDRILNVGFENDVVHRATGDAASFWGALTQADPLLSNADGGYATSTDNFVLFDTAYAAADLTLAVDSLLNPFSWWAHIDGVISDAMQRAGHSTFYPLMHQDSTIVVSGLNAALRDLVWVGDKSAPTSDHFGSPAFIIGTTFDDKLMDGAANDWLEGLGGDDIIRVSTGLNVVDAGAGYDMLRLTGNPGDHAVYRLNDGSLAFASDGGLTLAHGIEDVEFVSTNLLGFETVLSYQIGSGGLTDERWWLLWGKQDLAYQSAVQGGAGADTLGGRTVFGHGGADTITGTSAANLLHGGAGADVIRSGAGADRIYGGNDTDILFADSTGDRLNGGHGDDVFVFDARLAGIVRVEDFNTASGDADLLQFLNGSAGTALASARGLGGDTVITHGRMIIILDDTDPTSLSADNLLLV